MNNKHLICIMGPTASGKSALAIELAKHFQTEIISADSRQFYRELNIGTAKVSDLELEEVKHHFIDVLSVNETYNAGQFEVDALATLDKIFEKNDFAIMVGGSGLYLNAVLFGIDPFPAIPTETRLKTLHFYKENGLQALRDELRKLDPQYFLEVDLDNPRRLMRALEVCYATGNPYSMYRNQSAKKRNFSTLKIAYQWEKSLLHERINQRVDEMIDLGLIAEVQNLILYRDYPALDTIAYKEIFQFLDGEITKEEAIELIKKNTRKYAKRQMTWFQKDSEIFWFSPIARIEDFVKFIHEKINS
jgi:tRNA dimethylallyltransferase